MRQSLIGLAKKCGIRGYSTLNEDELIVAIQTEASDRPQLLAQLKSLREAWERQKEENEKRSFMDELNKL